MLPLVLRVATIHISNISLESFHADPYGMEGQLFSRIFIISESWISRERLDRSDRTVFICVPRIEHFQRHYLIFGNAIPYILFQFGDEETGEDIEIVVTRVGVRCPVTQQVMDRPVKNTICGHYYDEKGIEQVIKNRAAKAKYVHPLQSGFNWLRV